MLDSNGFVSTCNSTNFFIVVNKEIWTSTGEHCLNGVTRGAIIDLCRRNNILVYEKNFGIEDVYNADEAFLTSTPFCILPAVTLNKLKIGDGRPGKITNMLLKKMERKCENQPISPHGHSAAKSILRGCPLSSSIIHHSL